MSPVTLLDIVFDILFLNGSSLIGLPFSERVALLRSNVQPKEFVFQLVESWDLTLDGDNIRPLLSQALLSSYEGLMIKRVDSKYSPALRSKEWIKVKPDYIDSLSLEIDAVVIGADSGRQKSNSSLNLSIFTCAVREGSKYCILGRVGSGFTQDELSRLNETIEPLLEPFSKGKTYDWLCGSPRNHIVPQYIVNDISAAPVIQVRSHALVKSETYAHGKALRFPRFMKMRTDRSPNDCTSLEEILSWRLPEISFNTFASGKSNVPKRRKVTNRKPKPDITWTIAGSSEATDGRGLLTNIEFYVPYGDAANPKQALEKLILQAGGRITQNPKLTRTHVVVTGQQVGTSLLYCNLFALYII